MSSGTVYRLTDGVQVRREKFGLLFYDYRGPKLYFLPSSDLIEDDFFNGIRTAPQLVESVCAEHEWPRQEVLGKVSRILELLKTKGLIHEQSVC
jgi:putative mycofactocin binding protein MftB